ncbi:MAG TPA: hypothetical protein VHF00_02600 [Acidimicrobiales bacterium]|nr:hypothetical protein [Acidimicrobiales bacterium]
MVSPRLRAGAVTLALLAAAAATVVTGTSGAGAVPPDDRRRGVVHAGLRNDGPGGPCKGGFTLDNGPKGPPRCFHGPDPAPDGVDVRVSQEPRAATAGGGPATAAAPGAVQCYGDGTTGPRVQLVYARAADRADRYATYLATFRQIAVQVDDVFVRSALETGGVRHVRYVTDSSCVVSVANVVLSATGDDNIQNTANELEARGFSRPDRKYLVWMDANVYCGIAEIWPDDRPTADNYNNGPSNVPGMVARVDSGCWGLSGTNLVEAHELMHTLGGVQSTAPHGTAYNHCTDDHDRMCYPDGTGEPMSVECPSTSREALFDCNHEDYFNAARPPAGSYLATHWNVANSAFLASSGAPVSAWGYNGSGALGDGTTATRGLAQPVPGLTDTVGVAAGAFHSLAVKADGTVWAWGTNNYGQLGDGTTTQRFTPVRVWGLTGVTAVAAGAYHSVALRSDGTVWAWGWNGAGPLGDGTATNRSTPVRVANLTGVTAVAAGAYHSLAVRSDGTAWAWGWNPTGQLGDGTVSDRVVPVPVWGLSGVTSVAAGVYHSVALRSNGTVAAWGWNYTGQLGDGTATDRRTPVTTVGLSNVARVAAGFYHSVAVTRTGAVLGWGWNAYGQLGDGTTTSRVTAVAVSGMPAAASAVSAGAYHSLAVTDGGIVAWGANAYGQLGDGTTVDRRQPTPVAGAPTAARVAGGAYHSLSG